MRAFLTTCGQMDSGHTSWDSVGTPSPGLSWQQNPAVLTLNGSFLVHTFGASLVAQVSSEDTFARAHIHSACGHRAHLDTGLQHAWPPLQALGVPPNNHIRVSMWEDEPPRAQLEVALGLCTLTARGDFRSEASVTHNWTLALVNHCPLLEVSRSHLPLLIINHLLYAQLCTQHEKLWAIFFFCCCHLSWGLIDCKALSQKQDQNSIFLLFCKGPS